jgi:hypothetical protein
VTCPRPARPLPRPAHVLHTSLACKRSHRVGAANPSVLSGGGWPRRWGWAAVASSSPGRDCFSPSARPTHPHVPAGPAPSRVALKCFPLCELLPSHACASASPPSEFSSDSRRSGTGLIAQTPPPPPPHPLQRRSSARAAGGGLSPPPLAPLWGPSAPPPASEPSSLRPPPRVGQTSGLVVGAGESRTPQRGRAARPVALCPHWMGLCGSRAGQAVISLIQRICKPASDGHALPGSLGGRFLEVI